MITLIIHRSSHNLTEDATHKLAQAPEEDVEFVLFDIYQHELSKLQPFHKIV